MILLALTLHDFGYGAGILLGLLGICIAVWWYAVTMRVYAKHEEVSKALKRAANTPLLPSGRRVLHPELHPLSKDVIKNLREQAEHDHYHGASWESYTLLCDEVELLQMRNAELEAKLKEKS